MLGPSFPHPLAPAPNFEHAYHLVLHDLLNFQHIGLLLLAVLHKDEPVRGVLHVETPLVVGPDYLCNRDQPLALPEGQLLSYGQGPIGPDLDDADHFGVQDCEQQLGHPRHAHDGELIGEHLHELLVLQLVDAEVVPELDEGVVGYGKV